MRIVFFVNHFFPSVGGVQWSVLRTAEALAARGHELTLLTETPADESSDDTKLPFRVLRFRVPLRRPFTRIGYWRWMWSQRMLLSEADVLHFHDYTTFFHWFLPLRVLIRRPRYAVTFHGFEHWPIRLRHRFFRSVTAHACDVRFAVGDYLRDFYRHPIDAVFLGAPVRALSKSEGKEEAVFAYAGRLAADTGILPVLTALAGAAAESGIAVRIRIAGDGPLRAAVEQLQGSHVTMDLPGAVEDTSEILTSACWIIATGYLGILEAFTAGIPVIAPAWNSLKRRYLASIPEANSVITVLESEQQSRGFFLELLRGELDAVLAEKTVRAAGVVSQLTWADIAVLHESWYMPRVPAAGRAASQTQLAATRLQ